MKKYTTVFIDLDNTLFDFFASEHAAIKQLFKKYSLPNDDKTIKLYSGINDKNWKKFEKGIAKKEEIVVTRFAETLAALKEERDPVQMNNTYLGLLATYHILLPGAEELLCYLKGKGYTVCATTNGLSSTQFRRIKEAEIEKYFDYVFVSETVGYQKPSMQYFNYVAQKIGLNNKSEVILIGDSMTSDIQGGINFEIDTCWLDAFGEERIFEPTYTVHSLPQIKNIL